MNNVNQTDITLLEKLKGAKYISQYRPISLCNVLAKTITKMVPKRLKEVIGACIDQIQMAFIPVRLTTDNIMISFELIHSLRA